MKEKYYDPDQQHSAKKSILPLDIKNPEFTFEYAAEFQQSMQHQLLLLQSEDSIFPSPNCLMN